MRLRLLFLREVLGWCYVRLRLLLLLHVVLESDARTRRRRLAGRVGGTLVQ